MSEAAKKYLVAEYVPQLLKTRSILQDSDKSDYVIDLCRVLPVTTDGTFMLSLCNRVKVDLKEVGNNENILHLDLVIKVSKLCTCLGTHEPTSLTLESLFSCRRGTCLQSYSN